MATPGFRAQINSFRAVPVVGEALPTRAFVVAATVGADFDAGPLTADRPRARRRDRGDGWLAVQAPDGGEAYTRDGSLQVGADGQLLTHDGRTVLGDGGPIMVPPGSRSRDRRRRHRHGARAPATAPLG